MDKFICIQTTAPDQTIAKEIGERLVRLNLVACAQIHGPIESIYQWKNKYEHDEEWFLELKTISSNYNQVEKEILELHPYDVPQILVSDIKGGYDKYLDWLEESCNPGSRIRL